VAVIIIKEVESEQLIFPTAGLEVEIKGNSKPGWKMSRALKPL